MWYFIQQILKSYKIVLTGWLWGVYSDLDSLSSSNHVTSMRAVIIFTRNSTAFFAASFLILTTIHALISSEYCYLLVLFT